MYIYTSTLPTEFSSTIALSATRREHVDNFKLTKRFAKYLLCMAKEFSWQRSVKSLAELRYQT